MWFRFGGVSSHGVWDRLHYLIVELHVLSINYFGCEECNAIKAKNELIPFK